MICCFSLYPIVNTLVCSVSILCILLSSCMFGVNNATQYLVAHRILEEPWEETADFSAKV